MSADGKTLRVWRGGWQVLDGDGKALPHPQAGTRPTERTNDHWQNWLDCVKTRQQPRSPLASMAQTTIVCHLANASLLAGEPVRWSKTKMDLAGHAGEHTLSYRREYRKPWKLPIYTG